MSSQSHIHNFDDAVAMAVEKTKQAWQQGVNPVFFLEGPLGIGKTYFSKKVFSKFGVDENNVQSPTFLKLLEYPLSQNRIGIHIDAYRVNSADEFLKMGLEIYAEKNVEMLWMIEWPLLFLNFLKTESHLPRILNIKHAFKLDFLATQHQVLFQDVEI